MKKFLLSIVLFLLSLLYAQAQMDSSAWIAQGLSFSLPKGCEIIGDDSLHFEARKVGFSISLFSFKNTNFNLSNQAETTQESAKKVQYDKVENVVFFHLPNFKCCAITGLKNKVKVMIISLLNQKSEHHFTAVIVYVPEMSNEIAGLTKSFWKRK
jgi:hypothetical protein